MKRSLQLAGIAAAGLLLVACSSGGTSASVADQGQAWPDKNKTITIIDPDAPGGSTDTQMRLLARGLKSALGVNVVVQNVPGGNHVIGLTQLAKAKPDGYTIGSFNFPNSMSWSLPGQSVSYTKASFDWLAGICVAPDVIAVPAKSPYHSLKDIAEAAKREPGKIKVAVEGALSGDSQHVLAFERSAGVKFKQVIYADNGATKTEALLGGQVDWASVDPTEVAGPVASGDVRILAQTAETRAPNIDYPTALEEGYPITVSSWYTLVTPAGVPADIITKLEAAIKTAVDDPTYQDAVKKVGLTPQFISKADIEKERDTLDTEWTADMKEMAADQGQG